MEDFYCPISPFSAPIPGGLYPGKVVVLYGKVPNGSKRFAINLTLGGYEGADIALHMSFRFDEYCIIRNTRNNGCWGNEERGGGMPVSIGQYFEVMIRTEAIGYQIAINGVHFTSFNHRLPLQSVNSLQVDGSITISRVHITSQVPYSSQYQPDQYPPTYPPQVPYPPTYPSQGGYAPPPGPTPYPQPYPTPFQPYGGRVVYKPQAPFTSPIPNGFRVGSKVTVIGKSHTFAKRFAINLTCGGGSDIALHVNPRYEERVVVRNSMMGGQWGMEDRQTSHFPIDFSKRFVVVIHCHPSHFEIRINEHTYTFNHRLYPIERISCIEIDGDIKIKEVIF